METEQIEYAVVSAVNVNGIRAKTAVGDELHIPTHECGAASTSRVGDRIEAVVLSDRLSAPRLASVRRAERARSWETLLNNPVSEARLIGRDDSRAILDVGPTVHVDSTFVSDSLSVGEVVPVVFEQVDPWRNSVTLRYTDPDGVLAQYTVGDVLRVRVTGTQSYGAFVTNGDVVGLLHESELATRGVDPQDRFKVGDQLDVQIVSIENSTGRMSFSERRLAPEPYDVVREFHAVGDVLESHVTNVAPYGVFVSVGNMDGMVHFSEIPGCGPTEAPDLFRVNDAIRVRILSFDDERRRIALSAI